ncbi:hypothetical protein ACH47C_05930 [Streptomyces rishiriensis]|uniref:hypothetical protein n=1 Tax=Streptomyces rishiriensis TaxID=68264 RepID=UPI003411543A
MKSHAAVRALSAVESSAVVPRDARERAELFWALRMLHKMSSRRGAEAFADEEYDDTIGYGESTWQPNYR